MDLPTHEEIEGTMEAVVEEDAGMLYHPSNDTLEVALARAGRIDTIGVVVTDDVMAAAAVIPSDLIQCGHQSDLILRAHQSDPIQSGHQMTS